MEINKDLRWEQHDIVKTEDYRISVMEPKKGYYLLHCEVFNWRRSVAKELMEVWSGIVEEFYKINVDKLYCLIPKEETQIGKFAMMYGFDPQRDYTFTTNVGEEVTLRLFEFPVKEVVEES